jgi:hypothetical protein
VLVHHLPRRPVAIRGAKKELRGRTRRRPVVDRCGLVSRRQALGEQAAIEGQGRDEARVGEVAARVPVFTSCSLQQTKDSILLNQIVNLAQFISLDSFLNAQIAQIDITPNNKFEIIFNK